MRLKYLVFILLLILLFGCTKTEVKKETLPEGTNKIEVVEYMNGGGYTYIKGIQNGKEIWLAVREMPVEKGDVYFYSNAMEMKNFESKTLNRTFESILFANNISKKNSDKTKSKNNLSPILGHSQQNANQKESISAHTKPKIDQNKSINVAPLTDGQTIKSIFANKEKLKNKTIKIKGIVTKYNGGIMGKNWLHIQDGTKLGNSIDITVTTSQSAKVGETIIVEGTLTLDKDFGSGYFYDAIIENAKITVAKTI